MRSMQRCTNRRQTARERYAKLTDDDREAPAEPAQKAGDDEMLNDQMRGLSVPAGRAKPGNHKGGRR